MSLTNQVLSAWEISHRMAGYDPMSVRLRLPIQVRDNYRLILDAILNAHLYCPTLDISKWRSELGTLPEHHIRHHLDDILQCIELGRCKTKLLKWARIDRYDFMTWCERQGIPLPEFWFPPGWLLSYQWPTDDDDIDQETSTERPEIDNKLRAIQKQKIACQYVAGRIWEKEPSLLIKQVADRPEIQEVCGGSMLAFETVKEWISSEDPRSPERKRGRKPKNNSSGEQS